MHSDSTNDLQFETPEPMAVIPEIGGPLVQRCAGCGKPITSTYYAFRDKVACPECIAKINAPPAGLALLRVLKAGVFGLGAGILGAIIWYAVLKIAHAESGLVAIVVGYLVGKAVRTGSGGRGGLGFQIMAVIITYCCICANYMPDVLQGLLAHDHDSRESRNATPADKAGWKSTPSSTTMPQGQTADTSARNPGLVKVILAVILLGAFTFGIALAAPFLGGASNAIGLLIIGFALWEAWKFNRPRRLAITGPYRFGSTGPTGVIV